MINQYDVVESLINIPKEFNLFCKFINIRPIKSQRFFEKISLSFVGFVRFIKQISV
jgi:hypothetical protein